MWTTENRRRYDRDRLRYPGIDVRCGLPVDAGWIGLARSREEQLDVIAGKRDQLAGKIQETYGISKEASEKQISEWLTRQKEFDRPTK